MDANMYTNIKSFIINAVLDLFFPPICWICDQILSDERKVVCVDCFARLEKFTDNTEEFSGEEFLFNNLYILFEFDDCMRTLVHLIKYQDCRSLAKYFAREAFNQIKANGSQQYSRIIPVPLHQLRLRERGYNQSGEIARHLSTLVSIPDNNNPLSRIRHTRTQTKLSKHKRIKNISGAFICSHNVTNEHILLIDDVITTGSTVNECCRALLAAGARSVDVLALANPRLGNDRINFDT